MDLVDESVSGSLENKSRRNKEEILKDYCTKQIDFFMREKYPHMIHDRFWAVTREALITNLISVYMKQNKNVNDVIDGRRTCKEARSIKFNSMDLEENENVKI